MKLKLLFLCLLLSIQPLQAKSNESYLIASKDMPFSIIAVIDNKEHVTMHIVPDQLILPYKQSTIQVKDTKTTQQFKELLETTFHLSVNHIVQLNLKNISEDLNVPYTKEKVSSFSSLCDYFKQVKDHVRIQDVLHYSDYLKSTMKISDYYDLYKVFKKENIKFDYSYLNYIIEENFYLPLDLTFHKKD